MKLVNNQQIKDVYSRYQNYDYDGLYEAYDKSSKAKKDAWNYCKQLCREYNGKRLKVISRNRYMFSAGFIGEVDGKETFIYITKDSDRGLVL